MTQTRKDDFVGDGNVEYGLPIKVADEPQYVEVTAPATLQEGYCFTANLGGRMFNVTVPPGGVKEGQIFSVPYPKTFIEEGVVENESGIYQPPTGQWKDGLCDCCTYGCCNPQFWCAWCCAIPFIGQIMTRLGLTWMGSPGAPEKTKSTFKIILIIYIILEVIIFIMSSIENKILTNYLIENPDLFSEDATFLEIQEQLNELRLSGVLGPVHTATSFIANILGLVMTVWLIVTMVRTRMYIRRKYEIPATCCGENCVGDCCVSFWCTCCTLGQMARHTADYENHPSACCTSTGLEQV